MKRMTIPATVLYLVAAVLAYAGGSREPAPGQAPRDYAKPQALVDSAWIDAHAADTTVRILEIGGAREDYDKGHLPNAIFVSLERFTNPDDAVPGQVATREQMGSLLSQLGVTPSDTVVLYDGSSNLLAARAYWVLKYYRHADARIHNGGRIKWLREGRAFTTAAPAPTAATYAVPNPDPSIRTDWDYVVAHIDDPATLYCDARSVNEYLGKDVRAARGGNIPGSINVDWPNAVNQDGTFRTVRELSQIYRTAGFDPARSIITYCQTGVRGAHTWFVLKELLGYPDVRNYDGSWVEYGNRADSPIKS